LITQEHLEHIIKEIRYHLGGINSEIDDGKLGGINGIPIETPLAKVFVSFEYIREKANTIEGHLKWIEGDMKND